jgi:SAM-dependent methyltransferase
VLSEWGKMNKEKFYDKKFYDDISLTSYKNALLVLPNLLEILPEISSVIDFGCGLGSWLLALLELCREKYGKELQIQGLDGVWVDKSKLLIPLGTFQEVDFESDLVLDKKYDLAMSLEVAEHIPEKQAKNFINKLTRASEIILFSAAIPMQGGRNHVNEQWQSYWRDIFQEFGFMAVDCLRKSIWDIDEIEFWYKQNLVLYVRKDMLYRLKINNLDDYTRTKQLDLIHPDFYLFQMQKHLDKMPLGKLCKYCFSRLKKKFKILP